MMFDVDCFCSMKFSKKNQKTFKRKMQKKNQNQKRKIFKLGGEILTFS